MLLFLPLFSLAQNGFVINGNIAGITDGTEVKLTHSQDNNVVVAKGTVKGSVFNIKGNVPEPGLYFLAVGNEQPQHIYLENTSIKVSGTKKDIKNIKIEGSKSHEDFDVFRKTFNPLIGELSASAALINKTEDEKKRALLMEKYDSIVNRVETEVGNFVKSRPSSYVSPFLLFVTAQVADDPFLMEQRYNMLDENIRNSQIGKSLAEFIAYNKVGAVGTDAMDFVQNDVNGNPVSLSSFKGKYVLIDFWASWCKPCREENPNVVKAFQKFHDKNFTVLGVSLDREKEPWIKAIEKDNLTWTQVSDLQFWNNAAAMLYRVQGIPQNYLIDPNGKIIAKNLRGEELQQRLEALLK